MKKILLALLLSLSFTINAAVPVKYETKCIAGYMFAVVMVKDSFGALQGVSMVQIFKEAYNSNFPPQPMRCK